MKLCLTMFSGIVIFFASTASSILAQDFDPRDYIKEESPAEKEKLKAELEKAQEFAESYKTLIRRDPDIAKRHRTYGIDAYSKLAMAYTALGQYQDALKAWKEAILIEPDYATAHYCLGLVYLMLNDPDSTMAEYKILKELDKERAEDLFNEIQRSANREERFKQRLHEDVKKYKELIRTDPNNPSAHYHLGLIYMILGDKKSALKEYKILKGLDNYMANELLNLINKMGILRFNGLASPKD